MATGAIGVMAGRRRSPSWLCGALGFASTTRNGATRAWTPRRSSGRSTPRCSHWAATRRSRSCIGCCSTIARSMSCTRMRTRATSWRALCRCAAARRGSASRLVRGHARHAGQATGSLAGAAAAVIDAMRLNAPPAATGAGGAPWRTRPPKSASMRALRRCCPPSTYVRAMGAASMRWCRAISAAVRPLLAREREGRSARQLEQRLQESRLQLLPAQINRISSTTRWPASNTSYATIPAPPRRWWSALDRLPAKARCPGCARACRTHGDEVCACARLSGPSCASGWARVFALRSTCRRRSAPIRFHR